MTRVELNGARRTLIIGCSGSGKSTLAARLSSLLVAPHINLDSHYWRPEWEPTPEAEWVSVVRELAGGESWVIDGTYLSTLPERLERAELTLFLDFPRTSCLTGVFRRYLQYRGTNRPGLPEGCPETLSLEFGSYIWNYQRDVSPRVYEALRGHECLVFRSRAEVVTWLKSLYVS